MNGQDRLDNSEELVTFAQQFPGQVTELQAHSARKQQPVFFDQAADVVLDITTDGYETGSRDE